MNFRPVRPSSTGIDITPLVDVVFLLLIFFMVTTTFDRSAELSVELPEASTEQPEPNPAQVDVTIDAHGQIYVDGRALVNAQVETVRKALAEAAAESTGEPPPIVLSADRKTPHESVVTVMDAARQAGLVRLSFAARQPAASQ